MSEQESARLPDELRRDAARARSHSVELLAQSAEVAQHVADTGTMVAGTLADLAVQYPHHGRRLQALSRDVWGQGTRVLQVCQAEPSQQGGGSRG